MQMVGFSNTRVIAVDELGVIQEAFRAIDLNVCFQENRRMACYATEPRTETPKCWSPL